MTAPVIPIRPRRELRAAFYLGKAPATYQCCQCGEMIWPGNRVATDLGAEKSWCGDCWKWVGE